jgi:hypothetical protein
MKWNNSNMLQYTSILNAEYNSALEELMFFNPGQENALSAILDSIDTFGPPSVYIDRERLRVKVEKLDEVQTLFALDESKLVGVMIYSRVLAECLSVIHIAVNEDYSSTGKYAHNMLVMRMLDLIRNNARRIKGIKTLRVICNGNQITDYPV